MLYKEIYTHIRAKEVENFNKLLEERKKWVEKDASVEISKEYATLIINGMKTDTKLLLKSQMLAATHLNKVQ